MASMINRRVHAGRAPAVKAAALRRSTPAGPVKRFDNASYSYPPVIARGNPDVVTSIPTGSKALTGTFIAVGVAVFAVIGLLVWKYRRTQARKSALFSKYLASWVPQPNENAKVVPYSEKSSFDAIYGFGITKPEPAVHHGESTSPRSGKWVPQLRADIPIPPISARTSKAKEAWEKNLAKFMTPKKTVYSEAAVDPNAADIPIMRVMPPMPNSADKPAVVVMPPTPMKAASAESPPVTPDSRSNLLSPRSSSFNQVNRNLLTVESAVTPAAPVTDKSAEGKKVPRMMTVTTTFTPTLADELSITMGETVRLIEEYADEWCLVQRIGKIDEIKGIIPRFCISERKEMIPRLPHMGTKPSV